jgi:hypothetical protein
MSDYQRAVLGHISEPVPHAWNVCQKKFDVHTKYATPLTVVPHSLKIHAHQVG